VSHAPQVKRRMTVTILHVAAVMFSVTAFTTLYLVYTELLELREGMEELVGGARLGEVDKVMVDGTACLLGTGRKRSKQCWADMRHELWARELTIAEQLPPNTRGKYQEPINNWEPFDLLPPTYDCDPNNLKRVGSGDGGKWVCEPFDTTNVCVIISIGSNGNFAFEQGMKTFTGDKCKIYTFDCTGSWSDPSTNFYPWCVSGKDEVRDGKIYKRLITIMTDLGLTQISYLKVDVEGYEWEMMPDILDETNKIALPHQISFELHTGAWQYKLQSPLLEGYYENNNWLLPIIRLGRLLDKAGYRVALNEINVLCTFCTELIVIRRDIFM